jgi:LAO/AO transport system kinase
MVDFFLVLMLAGAGDELQGIKKGILELADLVAVNKADGDNAARARAAAQEYGRALHLVAPADDLWHAPVLTCSALHDIGLDTIWERVLEHHDVMVGAGRFEERRRSQQLRWMWSMVDEQLVAALRAHPDVARALPSVEAEVLDGRLTPTLGAARLLSHFGLAGGDALAQ